MHTTTVDSWIENLSWPQIEHRIEQGAIALLPVGAASKEHGRHLPLNTDFLQASWLASELATHVDALIWPVVNFGYYPAFVDYPGSISIPEEVFSNTVQAILEGIIFAGVRRTVILNTGISTIKALQSAVNRISDGASVSLHNVYSGPNFTRVETELSEQSFGGHADEVETSIMLAIDQSVVNLSLASPQKIPITRGLFNRTAPNQLNYSPDGVNGNPTLADKQKGVRLLDALLEDALNIVRAEADR